MTFVQGIFPNPNKFLVDGVARTIQSDFGTPSQVPTPFTAATFTEMAKNLVYSLIDTSNTANLITVSLPDFKVSDFTTDLKVLVIPFNTNTGATNIKFNTLDNVSVKKNNGIDLEANDIKAKQPILLQYVAEGYFELVNKDYDSKVTKALSGSIPYGGTTANVGNAYSIATPTISALAEGDAVCFKVNADATGAVTLNWDNKGAKAVVNAKGFAITNLKAGGIYTVRYGGTAFILQGEGGEYGTATANKVLAPYTIGTESGLVTGTIPSKGAQTYIPSTVDQTIAANQFLSGVQTILGDPDLIAVNIALGKNIFGIEGSFVGKIAKGTLTVSSGNFSVTGLAFLPTQIAIIATFSNLNSGGGSKSITYDSRRATNPVVFAKAGYAGFTEMGLTGSNTVYNGGFNFYDPSAGAETFYWIAVG